MLKKGPQGIHLTEAFSEGVSAAPNRQERNLRWPMHGNLDLTSTTFDEVSTKPKNVQNI